jgi:hypothetical protein
MEHETILTGVDRDRLRGQDNFLGRQAQQACQLSYFQAVLCTFQQQRDTFAGNELLQRFEPPHSLWRATLARRRGWIENHAAAHCVNGLRVASDESIAGSYTNSRVKHQLHSCGFTGQKLRRFERHDVSNVVRRAEVYVQGRPGTETARAVTRKELQSYVDARSRHKGTRVREPISACDGTRFDPREVQGTALTGAATAGSLILRMNASDPHLRTRWHDCHGIARSDLTRKHCPGHDSAVAAQGEHSIHREAKQALITAKGKLASGLV